MKMIYILIIAFLIGIVLYLNRERGQIERGTEIRVQAPQIAGTSSTIIENGCGTCPCGG